MLACEISGLGVTLAQTLFKIAVNVRTENVWFCLFIYF